MIRVKRKGIFTSPYDQYADRIGQEYKLIREIPHKEFDYREIGKMYIIQFPDGTQIDAWPEELEHTDTATGKTVSLLNT
jgi:hypothetical protein